MCQSVRLRLSAPEALVVREGLPLLHLGDLTVQTAPKHPLGLSAWVDLEGPARQSVRVAPKDRRLPRGLLMLLAQVLPMEGNPSTLLRRRTLLFQKVVAYY